ELAARIQNLIEEEFGPEGRKVVGRAISAATFVRPLPEVGGSTSVYLKRSATSGRLQAHRDELSHSDYLRVVKSDDAKNETELWRVSLRVGATQGIDYGSFVKELQQTVEPVIAAQSQRVAVLRAIDQKRREQRSGGAGVTGARVLLVGMPPAEKPADATVKTLDT